MSGVKSPVSFGTAAVVHVPKVRSSVVPKLRLISRLKWETYSSVIDVEEGKVKCPRKVRVGGK